MSISHTYPLVSERIEISAMGVSGMMVCGRVGDSRRRLRVRRWVQITA